MGKTAVSKIDECKILEWAGFSCLGTSDAKCYWEYPSGWHSHKIINGRPNLYSLDFQAKYLWPRLREHFAEKYQYTRYNKVHYEAGIAQFVFFMRDWIDKATTLDNPAQLFLEKIMDLLNEKDN